jgi:transcriptional regulator with XRE-family HTH domain
MLCEGFVSPMPALTFNHARLREWRLQSGKTAEEVCYRARVSYPYLRQLEDGTAANPSAALLVRIAEVYDRPLGELFTVDAAPASTR